MPLIHAGAGRAKQRSGAVDIAGSGTNGSGAGINQIPDLRFGCIIASTQPKVFMKPVEGRRAAWTQPARDQFADQATARPGRRGVIFENRERNHDHGIGKARAEQARRILEANDQLLRLGGNTEGIQPLRLGLSTLLVEQFIQRQTSDTPADIFIHADHSVPIGKGLIDG